MSRIMTAIIGNAGRKRICFVATVPYAINVSLRAHIEVLRVDYDVILVSNGSPDDLPGLIAGHVSFIPIRIERKISLRRDVLALILLWRLFRRERFDSVHSITPKAGLLSMLAARLAGVRLRIHTFTGQVWATERGLRRWLLKALDTFLAMNATRLFADGHSQRLYLIENGIVRPSMIDVLADGSFHGVDAKRFEHSAEARQQIRSIYGIPGDAIVFLYLGRLNVAKGLLDLSRAFATAAVQNAAIHLLVVGPDEEGLERELSALAHRFAGRVHRAGFVNSPESYMSAADVFCVPSHREGFSSALIEAASVGLPAIASRIYGVTDAVEDGVTGILHRATADREIADAMLRLASNDDLRSRMGDSARERAKVRFSEERVTKAFAERYGQMLFKNRIESK